MRHDFNELHRGRGIEEVQADEAVRPSGRGGQRRDGQARCVRGEDRVGLNDAVGGLPDLLLEREILGDRLDHDVAAAQVVERDRRVQPSLDGGPLVGADAFALDRAVERLGERGHAAFQGLRVGLADEGVEARGRADLRDARAHLTAAEHADRANLGHRSPLVSRRAPAAFATRRVHRLRELRRLDEGPILFAPRPAAWSLAPSRIGGRAAACPAVVAAANGHVTAPTFCTVARWRRERTLPGDERMAA